MNFSLPLAGMQNADAAFNSAAAAITQAFAGNGGGGASVGGGDSVDLSTEVAAMLKSKLDFMASTKLAVVENEMTQSTFSILG